jgi:hypothetical protein
MQLLDLHSPNGSHLPIIYSCVGSQRKHLRSHPSRQQPGLVAYQRGICCVQASYPNVNFKVVHLARGGIDVTPASMCWYQQAPQDADLILIGYSVNGCSGNMYCHNFMAPLVSYIRTDHV